MKFIFIHTNVRNVNSISFTNFHSFPILFDSSGCETPESCFIGPLLLRYLFHQCAKSFQGRNEMISFHFVKLLIVL